MAESIQFENLSEQRQQDVLSTINVSKTTAVRIHLCPECHTPNITKNLDVLGQCSYVCNVCNRFGPWSWRVTVRNPNTPKKGKK